MAGNTTGRCLVAAAAASAHAVTAVRCFAAEVNVLRHHRRHARVFRVHGRFGQMSPLPRFNAIELRLRGARAACNKAEQRNKDQREWLFHGGCSHFNAFSIASLRVAMLFAPWKPGWTESTLLFFPTK